MGTVIALKRLAQQSSTLSNCGLRELCFPDVPSGAHAGHYDGYACSYKRVRRGERLYRRGDPFASVYPVRLGSFKTSVVSAADCEKVMGYHMRGEIMGIDGLDTGQHSCTAIALEDSVVCNVPFGLLEEMCTVNRGLQRQFHRAISRQIDRGQGVMLMLGTLRAEERVAAHLLDLSERLGACGYSRHEFNLRMTRKEIGSLVGLKLETVSRTLGRLQERKLISVVGKAVAILDLPGLQQIAGQRVDPVRDECAAGGTVPKALAPNV